MSGGTNDSISAPEAGVPVNQSKTVPAIRVRGTVVPVEKKVDAPVFRMLPRKSATPFIMITVYGVLARQPRDGLTPIAERCHEASGTPSRGEMRKRSARVVTAGGRSATTSSNWNTTSFGLTPTLPVSGVIETITGAATSIGPPGGMPGDAQPVASSAAAISRRKALSPFQRVVRVASSTLPPSFVRLRPRRLALCS